jgi:hypothetical protein
MSETIIPGRLRQPHPPFSIFTISNKCLMWLRLKSFAVLMYSLAIEKFFYFLKKILELIPQNRKRIQLTPQFAYPGGAGVCGSLYCEGFGGGAWESNPPSPPPGEPQLDLKSRPATRPDSPPHTTILTETCITPTLINPSKHKIEESESERGPLVRMRSQRPALRLRLNKI